MIILIDGNNLIHKIPHLKKIFSRDKEHAQLSLVEALNSSKHKNDKLIVVFDGHGELKKSEIIYSQNTSADEIIRNKIENSSNPKSLRVVSSDNGITNFAKVCGCEVYRSEDFWKQLSSPASGKNINQLYKYDESEKPQRSTKKEIEELKKYFT